MADVSNMPLDFFEPLTSLQALNVSGTRLGNETGLLLEPLTKLKVNPLDICFNFPQVPWLGPPTLSLSFSRLLSYAEIFICL